MFGWFLIWILGYDVGVIGLCDFFFEIFFNFNSIFLFLMGLFIFFVFIDFVIIIDVRGVINWYVSDMLSVILW